MDQTKAYFGHASGAVTVVIGHRQHPLEPRLDIANHSPTGFAWGYHGSGPSQLALAILVDHLGDEHTEQALQLYQGFKAAIISHLPQEEGWRIDQCDIHAALEALVRPSLGANELDEIRARIAAKRLRS
jgi:hypothetical protein